MAKFCMFCGESLPDAALFCPSCGQRQPKPEPQDIKEEIIEEEDSDELDLLSQFGYISPKTVKKPPFTPNNKKDEGDKNNKLKEEETPELEILKEISKPKTIQKDNSQEKITKEEKISVVTSKEKPSKEEPQKDIDKDDISDIKIETKKKPELLNEDLNKEEIAKPKPQTSSRKQSVRHRQEPEIPFQPTETKNNENAMPIMEETEEKYELPDDFSVTTEEEEPEFASLDEMLEAANKLEEEKKLQKELEEKKKQNEEKVEAISAKKPTKSSRGFFRRKKELLEDSDDEEFNTELKGTDGEQSKMTQETLYADEVATSRNRKEAIIEDDDEDDTPRRRSGEGRKQVNTNTKQRRKSSRSADIDKKVYNIEQDLSQLDPEEKEYDGYYENVLPIDHDSLEKKKIDPKVLGIILGGGLVIFIFVYVLITYIMG